MIARSNEQVGTVKLYGSFIQCNQGNEMQTAMGSSIFMTIFNCRGQGSTKK